MKFELGARLTPEQAMSLAIDEAKQGLGFVAPNPVVGCVILDQDNRLIGKGAHLQYGQAHAEINAINSVKDQFKLASAKLFVTLEPCAHQGQTGSCAVAIAKLPITEVFYGADDPNPLVAGKGLQILIDAGKTVSQMQDFVEPCERLCEQFLYSMKNQTPFVSLKVATSVDGIMAMNDGQSQWITGDEARKYGRRLRGHYDATMVGEGTLRHDDPSLDFRDTSFADKKSNRIIILDPKGQSAERFKETKIHQLHEAKNIFVLTRQEHMAKWATNLVHVIKWESTQSGWEFALKNLYQKGITSIYVEGGSYVYGQLLRYQIPKKLYHFQAPKIIGEGVTWSQNFSLQSLASAPTMASGEVISLGVDKCSIFYF